MAKHVLLMGGLGNQLFQYARALKNESETALIDLVPTNRRNQDNLPDVMDFQLSPKVFITSPEMGDISRSRLLNLGIRISSSSQKSLVTKKIISTILSLQTFLFTGRFITFNIARGLDDFYSNSEANCVVGYFQNAIAVNEIRSAGLELKDHSLLVEKYKDKAKFDRPLIVHYRLTDYLVEDSFGVPSPDYYSEAINLMQREVEFGKIWVFSDEIERAKNIFPEQFLKNAIFISEPTASSAEMLEIMRLGFGYVIANSTFSWWAASLSRNFGVKVTSPDPWFSGADNPKKITPVEWIRLPKNPSTS